MRQLKHRGTELTATDMFCGAGGSAIGLHHTGLQIVYAMNHWKLALRSHNANFPNTTHIYTDVSTADPRTIQRTNILWSSPECQNHSLAKGKKRPRAQVGLFEGKRQIDPAANRSRATMLDVPRFAEVHDYDMIVVENVVDARAWVLWDAWIHAMRLLNYDYHIIYLNSMFAHMDVANVRNLHDFAPQSRDRMYVVFWKKGNPRPDLEFRPKAYCPRCDTVIEAVQTWKDTPAVRRFGGRWGRYGPQYLYTCQTCHYAAIRRHGRKMSNTHLREAEVVPFHFAAWNAIDWSLPAERIGDRDRPLKPKTLRRIERGAAKGRWLIVDTAFGYHDSDKSSPLSAVLPTQTTGQTLGLASPFIFNTLHGDSDRPVDGVMPTQTGRQSLGLVMPFIAQLRNNMDAAGIDEPLGTITAGGGHHGLCFLTSVNDFDDRTIPVDEAMGTQTTQQKWGLTLPPAFLTSYYNNGTNSGVEEAMGTLTGMDRHGLVHLPFMLGRTGEERPAVDGPAVDIEDWCFRMLQPHEIGKGMAFPADYHVEGTKRERVKQYGNAVTPPAAKLIVGRCAATFR